jgi:hypothetical protein
VPKSKGTGSALHGTKAADAEDESREWVLTSIFPSSDFSFPTARVAAIPALSVPCGDLLSAPFRGGRYTTVRRNEVCGEMNRRAQTRHTVSALTAARGTHTAPHPPLARPLSARRFHAPRDSRHAAAQSRNVFTTALLSSPLRPPSGAALQHTEQRQTQECSRTTCAQSTSNRISLVLSLGGGSGLSASRPAVADASGWMQRSVPSYGKKLSLTSLQSVGAS